jgi:hypothetical protein
MWKNLLHLQDINLETMLNNGHGNHLSQMEHASRPHTLGWSYTFQESPLCWFLSSFALPEWSCQKIIDSPPFELSSLKTTKAKNTTITMKTYVRYMWKNILGRWKKNNKEIWKKFWRRWARWVSHSTKKSLMGFHVAKLIKKSRAIPIEQLLTLKKARWAFFL